MTIGWHFDNTYSKLSDNFKEIIKPTPVQDPELIILNEKLAEELNLDFSNISKKELAKIFSGNILPEGSSTIAQAYAGHQFGHFTMLGDGRAILLGEHLVNKNKRFDIQFKGSGKTSFSRSGDGRAVLGPMLREYIISEAINALNIPTTRSLAVISTGENVVRENLLPGAILTRIASSHIRVGTFQYIAAKQNKNDLNTLVDYTIGRHYPEIQTSKNKALDLLNLVMEKQCQLVVNWMRVGFIHGVMNTDNMAISGETIDYGPCAFMDHYDPKTVFSSIDRFGRYSFSNQPPITKWNLARFAECLIPLIDKNEDTAIKIASETINNFQNIYEEKWLNMMRDKLGFFGEDQGDKKIIEDLLNWMEQNKADYTNTFCYLMNKDSIDSEVYKDQKFLTWIKNWKNRVLINHGSIEKSLELMKNTNPVVIPRNHKVEEALLAANENNLDNFNKLLSVLKNPYDNLQNIKEFQSPSSNNNYQTYCGT
jgi:uncharacterized protein YdiU (UPF0061 family)